MFGNHSTTRSWPSHAKKSSGQNSPMIERASDDKQLSFDQSTSSTVTLTDQNVSMLGSPAGAGQTSTPITNSSMDVADFGKSSGKSKAHRRTKSLERGFNTNVKIFDNSGVALPKRMQSVLITVRLKII